MACASSATMFILFSGAKSNKKGKRTRAVVQQSLPMPCQKTGAFVYDVKTIINTSPMQILCTELSLHLAGGSS